LESLWEVVGHLYRTITLKRLILRKQADIIEKKTFTVLLILRRQPMQLSYLEEIPNEWHRLLVIGRTIERNNEKYHIIGMTMGEDTNLYILEPFSEPARRRQRARRNHRAQLKQHEEQRERYLHCREIYLGDKRLKVQGGCGSPLRHAEQDYRTICLFIEMMRAGWTVPDWLREKEWGHLQLVSLHIAGLKRLPKYSPDMPITIKHRPDPVRHIVEKNVTLTVGKSRSFHFTDHEGDEVWCHINRVTLIDVWKDTKEELDDPKYMKKVSPERLQEAKEHCHRALEQNVPKGMCYIGIEYECSKDLNLQFYSKEYLKSCPKTHNGSASFLMMRLKPDRKTGTHGLPLKGDVIQAPVPPDTVKIPAEMFLYFEKAKEWEEQA